jgi:AcrR family transcriptional regulator
VSFVPYHDERRPRRPALDREQVVKAALELLDADGLGDLTMRRLAARLGVRAPSLYVHVRDKQELLTLIAEALSAEIPPPPPTGDWAERAREMARGCRRALLAHRDSAQVFSATAPLGPRRLALIEATLGVLLDAGLAPADAARASYHLNNFVMEFAADEGRYAAMAQAQGLTREAMMLQARDFFAGLPAADYPALQRYAGELTGDDPDVLFEFGLDMCLAGVRSMLGTGAQSVRKRPERA